MTPAQLEAEAHAHRYQCTPRCPVCLGIDLQAKADAVRESCARLADEMAEAEARANRKQAVDVLKRFAAKIRGARRAA